MMKNHRLLYLIICLFVINSCQENKATPAHDLNASIDEDTTQIVGTWKLVEYADLNESSNEWEYPYGKVKGYFTYTKNGIVNLNLSNETPMELSRDSMDTTKLTFREVWTNSVGYFGTYTIDHEESAIIHHVEGGSLPWYVGTDQKRPFYFEGDTLVIGYKNDWIRKLVKVD